MFQLMFLVVFFEMAVTIALLFQTPLRWLLVIILDRLKRGRGMVVARTVAIVMVVVFGASLYNVMNLDEVNMINPALGVLAENHLLETSLLGFCLFLAVVIDRIHCYTRDLHTLRQKL